jgi:hypothetical protein
LDALDVPASFFAGIMTSTAPGTGKPLIFKTLNAASSKKEAGTCAPLARLRHKKSPG